jgi:hypothetical protein
VPNQLGTGEIAQAVINTVQAKANGGSVYLRVVLVDPETDSWTPVIFYRLTDVGGGTPGAWVEQQFPDWTASGGFVELNTGAVPVDVNLDVQAGYIGSNGSYGPRSTTEEVHTTADPTAPLALTSFSNADSAPHLGRATLGFATGNDTHVRSVSFYRIATGATFNPSALSPIATLAVSPNATYSYVDGDATRANVLTDGDFATSPGPWTLGTGWTIAGGVATKAAGVVSVLYQSMTIASGDVVRVAFTITSYTAGNIRARLGTAGTTPLDDAVDHAAAGTFLHSITATGARNSLALRSDASFAGSVDNVIAYKQTATTAPQGAWDYYAVPLNGSAVTGPSSGPVTVQIV